MQNPNQGGQGQVKYKTMLCKHFETPKGCVYKDKCQFAHGAFELNSSVNVKKVLSNLKSKIYFLLMAIFILFVNQ